jgi:hypothetical protein
MRVSLVRSRERFPNLQFQRTPAGAAEYARWA